MLDLVLRFLARVAILAHEPIVDAAQVLVDQVVLERERAALHRLRLAVAAIGVANPIAVNQPDDVARIEAAVAKPPAPHVEAPLHAKRSDVRRVGQRHASHLVDELRRRALVGVEHENPLVPGLRMLERPVALTAEASERMLEETRTRFARDPFRSILTEGIDDDDVVAPRERRETRREMDLLVQR